MKQRIADDRERNATDLSAATCGGSVEALTDFVRGCELHAPKPASISVRHDGDPAIAAFDGAPEEPLSDEERVAFEEAMASPDPGISTEDLLERLRPKP